MKVFPVDNFQIVNCAARLRRGGSAGCGEAANSQDFLIIEGENLTTEYLLNKEVDRVLAALMPSNRLVMRVILHTGLRVSDVLSLKTEQLASRFWITEAKTKKRRFVGLPKELLCDLIEESGAFWVFEGKDPRRHRTRQAVWADVKRAALLFRLPQVVGTHSGRKVYAVELLRKYGNIAKVQKALKHRYESTTVIYALADKLLEQKYKKRRGRA